MTTTNEDILRLGQWVNELATATAAGFAEVKKIDESQDRELVELRERLDRLERAIATGRV